MAESKLQTRYSHIDVAKGIGIILVIMSHILSPYSTLSVIIYRFHVPLFFILAGVFAKPDASFFDFLKKSSKRLLLPYAVVFIIGVIFTLVINGPASVSLSIVAKCFYLASPYKINVGAIWFLPCLFSSSLLFNILYKLILRHKNIFLNFIIFGALCLSAFYAHKLEAALNFRFPFKLHVALMALVFYSVGFYMKDLIINQTGFEGIFQKLFVSIPAAIATVFIPFFIPELINTANANYGTNLFIYLFVALCGSFLTIVIGSTLYKSKFLSFVGKNSLMIFSLHTIVIAMFNHVAEKHSWGNGFLVNLIETAVVLLFMTGFVFVFNYAKSKTLKT